MSQYELQNWDSKSESNKPQIDSDSTNTDERGTQKDVINKAISTNNGLFEFDLAAGAEPRRIGAICLTKEDNSLTSSWNGTDYNIDEGEFNRPVVKGSSWLNPPFSLNEAFARKLHNHFENNNYLDYTLFVLSSQSTSTSWFHDYILPHTEYLCIPDGRYTYTNTGNKPGFVTFIAGMGDIPDQFVEFFHREGKCLEVMEQSNIAEDIFNFISNSVHASDNNAPLISTQYRDDEPKLNNVGRDDILELEIRNNVRGYESLSAPNQSLEVRILTWSEEENSYEILAELISESETLNSDTHFIIYVDKEGPETFDVCHQVGSYEWRPTPIKDIHTITNKIEWSATNG